MYLFTIICFLLALLSYNASPISAGLILLACIAVGIFYFSKGFRDLAISIQCLLLVLLVLVNIFQWFSDPSHFSSNWATRMRSSQGYLYLILILLAKPHLQRMNISLTSLDRFSISFFLTSIPFVYILIYAYSFIISGGGRASFLMEHNFEMLFLNIFIALKALLVNRRHSTLLRIRYKKQTLLTQGILLSLFTRSLSGVLGFTIVLISFFRSSDRLFANPLSSSFLVILKYKSFYKYIIFTIFALMAAFFLISYARTNVGFDRLFYLQSFAGYNFLDFLFGRGIASILPIDMSTNLLAHANLRSQLDELGFSTSLLLHSAWLRVFADIGILGLSLIIWSLFSLFSSLPLFQGLMILGPIFASGLSVGSFFNPLGSFALYLSVLLLVSGSRDNLSVPRSAAILRL